MLTILSNITTQTNAFISKKDIALGSLVTINLILMYNIGTITYARNIILTQLSHDDR